MKTIVSAVIVVGMYLLLGGQVGSHQLRADDPLLRVAITAATVQQRCRSGTIIDPPERRLPDNIAVGFEVLQCRYLEATIN